MKFLVIILFFIGVGVYASDNAAYGIYIPESPEELLEQSQVIFVGNITSVKVLEFEKSTYVSEKDDNGQESGENYILSLDEYAVSVEEFVKNPQDLNVITVRQPTISLPDRVGAHVGFDLGDRMLFYVKNFDGNNTYSPESFKIPKQCDAKSVLVQPRIQGVNSFKIIQEGIEKGDNFTANNPIQLVYEKDMRTLSGKSFDIVIHITKNVGNDTETVFSQEIHTESNPCEWIASAEAEITLEEGDYRVSGTSGGRFSVISDMVIKNPMSPLKQYMSGIPSEDVLCKEGLDLAIKSSNDSPACVKPETKQELIERGWAKHV